LPSPVPKSAHAHPCFGGPGKVTPSPTGKAHTYRDCTTATAQICAGKFVGGLVSRRIVRRGGEQAKPRAEPAHDGRPEPGAFFDVEDLNAGRAGDPRFLCEFIFQLPLAPAGITDKCPHGNPLFRRQFPRFLDFQVRLAFYEVAGALPAEDREGQLVLPDGAADEYRQIGKLAHLSSRQQVGDRILRGTIDDDAVRPLLRAMCGDINH